MLNALAGPSRFVAAATAAAAARGIVATVPLTRSLHASACVSVKRPQKPWEVFVPPGRAVGTGSGERFVDKRRLETLKILHKTAEPNAGSAEKHSKGNFGLAASRKEAYIHKSAGSFRRLAADFQRGGAPPEPKVRKPRKQRGIKVRPHAAVYVPRPEPLPGTIKPASFDRQEGQPYEKPYKQHEDTTFRSAAPPPPKRRWEPTKKLTFAAMAGLRELHTQDPAMWTRDKLSHQFGISYEAVTRILRSKFRAREEAATMGSVSRAGVEDSDSDPATSLDLGKWDRRASVSDDVSPVPVIRRAYAAKRQLETEAAEARGEKPALGKWARR